MGSLPKVETDHDTGSDNAGLETGRKIHHLCISAVDGLTGSKAPGCLAAKLFHDRFQKPYRVVERASRFCLPMCAVTQKTHNFHFLAAKLSHHRAILRLAPFPDDLVLFSKDLRPAPSVSRETQVAPWTSQAGPEDRAPGLFLHVPGQRVLLVRFSSFGYCDETSRRFRTPGAPFSTALPENDRVER